MFREKQRDIAITKEELIQFESLVSSTFESGKIKGPVHLSYGNEEYLIDLFQYVHPDDAVFSTWRNHYHALLHGVPKETLWAKILDSKSISFQSPENNFYTSAIVNGIVPIAVGRALGIKWNNAGYDIHSNTGRMVWCFVGDMVASSGIFFEAVKYSVFNELPIHFVIENNHLSTNTPSAISWGLKVDSDTASIEAGLSWMSKEQREKYISYFEYKRDRYPHVGVGRWIHF